MERGQPCVVPLIMLIMVGDMKSSKEREVVRFDNMASVRRTYVGGTRALRRLWIRRDFTVLGKAA